MAKLIPGVILFSYLAIFLSSSVANVVPATLNPLIVLPSSDNQLTSDSVSVSVSDHDKNQAEFQEMDLQSLELGPVNRRFGGMIGDRHHHGSRFQVHHHHHHGEGFAGVDKDERMTGEFKEPHFFFRPHHHHHHHHHEHEHEHEHEEEHHRHRRGFWRSLRKFFGHF